MKSKNILILGGAGQIGKLLVSNLDVNNDLFLLDKNLPKEYKSKYFKFIKCDLLKSKSLSKLPKNIDIALFLVGHIGGPGSLEIKNLKKYIDYNCETLIRFLKVAKKNKIKKIIFTSTEHVFGDEAKKIYNTKILEPNPKNYYGVSKLLSEKILYNFYKENLTNIDILRIPRVVFGDSNNLISTMIISAISKKKIIINNTRAKFNFIYSNDLLKVFETCLDQNTKGFRILNIFNNSKPMSIQSIAKLIQTKLDKNLKIIFSKKKLNTEYNPLNLIVSNSYTKKILNWKPLFDNKKIIKELINIYETKKNFK
jgi:nucleoside-diphosphate-sugar epimerase